jgi:hypothetical protein
LVMGAVIAVSGLFLNKLPFGSGRVGSLIIVSLQVGIGAVAYIGAALLLKMQELRELPKLILRRRIVTAEASAD